MKARGTGVGLKPSGWVGTATARTGSIQNETSMYTVERKDRVGSNTNTVNCARIRQCGA